MGVQPKQHERLLVISQIAWLLASLAAVLLVIYIADSQQQHHRQLKFELQLRDVDVQLLYDQLAENATDLSVLTDQLERQNAKRPGQFPVAGF